MTLVINLFGGPGTGKSSTAASIFSLLKAENINCEMALEFAKDKVWEGSAHILDNQLYVFGKQYHRIKRLEDKVDVIITDSPILLSLIYGFKESVAFHNLVREKHYEFDSINYFLKREKAYNPAGRVQTEDKAKLLDLAINSVLLSNGIKYIELPADKATPILIVKEVLERINLDIPTSL